MKRILVSVIATFFVVFLHGQEVELSLNLEKGKEYRQVLQNLSIINQQIQSQDMTMEMSFDASVVMKVKELLENGYLMEVRYEKLMMSVKTPYASMEFGSETVDENDVFGRLMSALKDVSFDIVMTRTGKVSEVRNIESLWEAALDQVGNLDANQREQAVAQIKQGFGENAFKGNIELATAIFPDHPVREGDKWTIHTELEAGMASKVASTYELTGLTAAHAKLKGNSQIETLDKDAYIEANGMPVKYDLAGAMISLITIDRETGWIVEGQISQEINGETFIMENPQLPDGMVIPMTMLNDIKITGQ